MIFVPKVASEPLRVKLVEIHLNFMISDCLAVLKLLTSCGIAVCTFPLNTMTPTVSKTMSFPEKIAN